MGEPFEGLISVAIPTVARDDHLRRLLQSLLAAETPGPFEVLVADQAPEDRQAQVLAGLDPSVIRWLRSPAGKSPALNHALREARGEVFACLDDDVTVLPEWFTLLRQFAGDEPFECLWGSVRRGPPPDPDAFVPYTGDGAPLRYQGMARGGRMHGMGANVAFRTSALRALRGFDEAFGPGCLFPASEDRDLAGRAARNGYWTRFEPDFGVLHWSARRTRLAKPMRCGRRTSGARARSG